MCIKSSKYWLLANLGTNSIKIKANIADRNVYPWIGKGMPKLFSTEGIN